MFSNLLFSLTVALAPAPSDSPIPPPSAARLTALRTRADVVSVAVLEDGSRAPAEIVLPVLLNRRQTLAFMNANYPEGKVAKPARDAIAWVFVDRAGRITASQLAVTSGSALLDSLSIRTFAVAQFAPATLGRDTLGVWVPFPARIPDKEEIATALATMDGVRSERPVKTAFTDPPELLNRTRIEAAVLRVTHSVSSALNERNEAFLRSQKIGGRALLWLYIDERGNIGNVLINKSSGNEDLDNSAIQIANMMRFAPARNHGKPVDAWIEVPIAFTNR